MMDCMIEILDKRKCCGCGACANICPSDCIDMIADEEGFLYPEVDIEKCIRCGKCNKVCPFSNYCEPQNEIEDICYAVQYKGNNADAVLKKCASGGAYTAMAEYVLKNGGVVYGAGFDDTMHICHLPTKDPREFTKFSSSKYVQSDMGQIYKDVKHVLQSTDKLVLFSGTPCQIVAMKRYLGREYDNLICADVICAGVASPKVYKEYLSILEKKYSASVKEMNFRKKEYGYHSFATYVRFDNCREYVRSRLTDYMIRCFTAHICDRPSCGECVIKGENRYSDVSLFDCWHYQDLTGKPDDDRGHTAVLIHTEKGKELLMACREWLNIEPIDAATAIAMDGNMVNGIQEHHKDRELFFSVLAQQGLEQAVFRTVPIRFADRLGEKSKKYLYAMGILDFVKRIMKNRGV